MRLLAYPLRYDQNEKDSSGGITGAGTRATSTASSAGQSRDGVRALSQGGIPHLAMRGPAVQKARLLIPGTRDWSPLGAVGVIYD